MLTRRLFCGCLAGAVPFAATAARAQSPECAVFTRERQKSTAPDDAIVLLKAGNARFTAGKSINCDLMAQVKQTAGSSSALEKNMPYCPARNSSNLNMA